MGLRPQNILMIQFDTTQTRSLAKPTETPKSSIMLGGGGGWGRGPADFQARLFVSLDTTVSSILFHTLFSDDL